MLTTVMQSLYAVACAVLAGSCFRVLVHMSLRTPIVRRTAFVLLTWGGALGLIEVWAASSPRLSLAVLAIGSVLLLSCGWRHGKRTRT